MMSRRYILLLFIPSVRAFIVPPFSRLRDDISTARYLQDEKASVQTQQQPQEPTIPPPADLTTQQADFVCGYLNKHHPDLLVAFVKSFSSIGQEMAKANTWSGGSFSVLSARMLPDAMTVHDVTIQAQVQRRHQSPENRTVQIPLDADVTVSKRGYTALPPIEEDLERWPIDSVCRKLCRLCWMVNEPKVTGKLIQLAIQLDGRGVGKLPENMFLNQVPHNAYVRQWFYDMAAAAVHDAVVEKQRSTSRLQLVVKFPETNPSMDSYRIGTLLELVRSISVQLAQAKKRVRVCVQGSMGVGIFTGLPKQLTGVATLLQRMDWQTGPGELYEGIVGEYVRFGAVGAEHVQDDDDCFLLIAPQNMVGTDSSIHPLLKAMVDKAGEDRPVILINPDLTDKVSAAGQQSIRGRSERIDFEQSFETTFQFANTYISGTSYFPILGATTKLHPTEPWITYQRRDFSDGKGEIYVPVLAGETPPSGENILAALDR